MTSKVYPSRDTLLRLFRYDAASGQLIWQNRPEEDFKTPRASKIWNAKHPGRRAGSVWPNGYTFVWIGGEKYRAHRLVLIMALGTIPTDLVVDHFDGNRSNNTIENLRLVTPSENAKNSKPSKRNTSGIKGVSWHSRDKVWRAAIGLGGKVVSIGDFPDKAVAARAAADFYRANGFTERHICGG